MAQTTSSPSTSVATGTPPAQIDGRRAQQLLERALVLSERGDVGAAILSCRQAVTLNPTAPQAYSMLGLLLERAGDSQGAIAAYEKVIQLDPGSLLERESVARLRTTAAQSRTTRDLFVFDEGELFDERAAELTTSDGVAAPDHSATPTPTSAPLPSPVLNGTASSTPAPSAAAERSIDASPAARAAATAAKAKTPPPRSGIRTPPGGVLPPWEEAPTPSTLQRLLARPSYYFRGLPLSATALAALLFLLWAHHFAASREVATPTSLPNASTTVARENESTPDQAAAAPNPSTAPNGAAPSAVPTSAAPTNVTNGSAPSPDAPNPPPAAPPVSAPAHPATTAPHAPAPAAPAPTPRVPVIPSPNTSVNPALNSGGAMPDLPRPRIPLPSANDDEPARGVAGGASSGGEPLNPGGAPNRDFTRVTPTSGRTAAPPRASALAAREERLAASGNAGAIAAATRAIESGDDSAVRYQQRAQLYLVSGNSGRAISDFRSAIAGYNDMIARGDRVALARAGIAASQRGIQIARTR